MVTVRRRVQISGDAALKVTQAGSMIASDLAVAAAVTSRFRDEDDGRIVGNRGVSSCEDDGDRSWAVGYTATGRSPRVARHP